MTEPRTIAVMGRVLDQQDGLGVYSLHLLRHLFTLDRNSRYLLLLNTPRAQHELFEFPNVQVRILPARSKLLWDQLLVPWVAHQERVDLIFNPKFSIPLLTQRRCAFVLQGADWFVNPGNYPWWDNLYIRLMLPLYCRRATQVLAISQATLDDLARYAGIDVAHATITHAGIGPNFTPDRDADALESFRADRDLPDRFILTVARVLHTGHASLLPYPGGNNERLVRAYQKYRQRSARPLPLVVVGRHVEAYLRAHGCTDAELTGVYFTGFIPNDQIHMAYQLAHCFVLATLCESFGLPIVEALATGCPAIVPNTCAGPEVAGNAARLIDPRDEEDIASALAEVTGSDALREQMRQRGLVRAQGFSWRETAQRTLGAFDRALSTGTLQTIV